MNNELTIYHFLASQNIDYSICSIEALLNKVEVYFQLIEEEKYFSDQMLIFSQSLEENRNGLDALRVNMKALDLVSRGKVADPAGRKSD